MVNFLRIERSENAASAALLLLRIVFGLFMATHGYDKLSHFKKMEQDFPDPLHITVRISLICTIFAELFCSSMVVLGLFTRAAALPIIFCMIIAAVIINGGKPLLQHELAPLYLTVFLSIAVAGPGSFSIDRLLFKDKTWKKLKEKI
jgi:putative oxidoreductase